MDVTVTKVPDIVLPGSSASPQSGAAPADGSANTQGTDAATKTPAIDTGDASGIKAKPKVVVSHEDVSYATDALNKFLKSLDTGIQFRMYGKPSQLVVQVVDENGQVLKEFPPHQLIDTIDAIREYVGALLDKKA